jgi:hypothetical protein
MPAQSKMPGNGKTAVTRTEHGKDMGIAHGRT